MIGDVASVDKLVSYTGNDRVLVGNAQSLPISHLGFISSFVQFRSLSL